MTIDESPGERNEQQNEAAFDRHLCDSVRGIQPAKVEFKVMHGALSLGDFDDGMKAAFAMQASKEQKFT